MPNDNSIVVVGLLVAGAIALMGVLGVQRSGNTRNTTGPHTAGSSEEVAVSGRELTAGGIGSTGIDPSGIGANTPTGTIEADLGYGEFGTGGIVSADAPERGGLTPYQQELLDTDVGE